MEFLPFDMNYLTDKIIKKAEIELGETSKRRKEALTEMRNCIKDSGKYNYATGDNYLLPFLRAKKFNVKRAIAALQHYCQAKEDYKELSEDTQFETVLEGCRKEILSVLPYRDVDGAMLLLFQFRNWDTTEMNFVTVIHNTAALMLGSIDMHPATQICGVKLIIDAKGISKAHMMQLSPKWLYAMSQANKNLPIRFPAFHIVNESVLHGYVWNIIKYMMTDKLRKRVNIHSSNLESLHSKINPALLPESLGGNFIYDSKPIVDLFGKNEKTYLKYKSFCFNKENNTKPQ